MGSRAALRSAEDAAEDVADAVVPAVAAVIPTILAVALVVALQEALAERLRRGFLVEVRPLRVVALTALRVARAVVQPVLVALIQRGLVVAAVVAIPAVTAVGAVPAVIAVSAVTTVAPLLLLPAADFPVAPVVVAVAVSVAAVGAAVASITVIAVAALLSDAPLRVLPVLRLRRGARGQKGARHHQERYECAADTIDRLLHVCAHSSVTCHVATLSRGNPRAATVEDEMPDLVRTNEPAGSSHVTISCVGRADG